MNGLNLLYAKGAFQVFLLLHGLAQARLVAGMKKLTQEEKLDDVLFFAAVSGQCARYPCDCVFSTVPSAGIDD